MNEKYICAGDLLRVLRDDPEINGTNFARVKRYIENAPAEEASKWIPVTERLPDKHGKPYVCWLTFPYGGAFAHIINWHEYGDNGYVNGKHFSDEGLDGMKVTHWMEMPEPPKESDDGL